MPCAREMAFTKSPEVQQLPLNGKGVLSVGGVPEKYSQQDYKVLYIGKMGRMPVPRVARARTKSNIFMTIAIVKSIGGRKKSLSRKQLGDL